MIANSEVTPPAAASRRAASGRQTRLAHPELAGIAPDELSAAGAPPATSSLGAAGSLNGFQSATAPEDPGGRAGWRAVYTILERGNGRRHWLRVGIAFVNRDQSLNVRLDALPVSGQLHIREAFPREREGGPGLGGELPPQDPGGGWRDGG